MAAATLKPFVFNTNDLLFLLSQVNFVPLFDGPANSNGIVDFDPATMDAWDANGNKVWTHGTGGAAGTGTYKGVALTDANVGLLGHGFPQVSAPVGVRDVSGLHNNLFGSQADWGAVDVPFRRDIAANFDNYVTSDGLGGTVTYVPGENVIDYMPRIISRTITTGGVNLLQDTAGILGDIGALVNWDSARYGVDTNYTSLIDGAGVDTTKLVEGAKIVAPAGMSIAWDPAAYNASLVYKVALISQAQALATFAGGDGKLYGSIAGGSLVDGQPVYFKLSGIFVPATINDGGVASPLIFDAQLFLYKTLISNAVASTAGLQPGDTILVTAQDLIDTAASIASIGIVDTTSVDAMLTQNSGYGLLETLGHVDFQNPTSGEFFIGSENPGVAPVNSWFAIFGQFFDHGLDLIGKGGNGTITIALDPNDPLYGVIGPNGQPTTSITISRATIAGSDGNGDPNYVNHTSPFIDQSQTYGSIDQITQLLRKWVPDAANPGAFKAGIELFDGDTLVDTWMRKVPVYNSTTGLTTIVETPVTFTLPTLNELRAHVLATERDALTWEDVLDYRNRDANGDLSTGNSGHSLILDMNPHFDGVVAGTGHISETAIAALNAAFGTSHTTADFNVTAVLPYVTGNFSIKPDLTNAQHDAVSEILMQSVGDHYIAGDGRVNENFGLTSIHHVFHEEHNYQVENLKSWIYQHDAANSPTEHVGLHAWQIDTGTQDTAGNFTYGVGGDIAWDTDKMFEATKLVVEMEYQHAAVDQYARTITPRIQEFVGYSTGVDATVSLEYSQVAFRFGHSTIRETIDTLDPSGWMLGNVTRYALEKAFLAPQTFAEEGVAAITLGLARQQMSEVDEFITPALNQGLLGQPLDLAAINIARGRDLGIPTLNDFRAGLGLVEYTSWADFGANMIHPESLVNFIAAYSFGGDVASAEAAMLDSDFMNNTGATIPAGADGFDKIDSWIGGLAEAHVPGGLLGETFDAVFVAQIQSLMDGDRFYYLYRLFGTNIHEEVNNGQFKDIVERNTGLSHLNGSIFAYADKYYDFTREADGSVIDATDILADTEDDYSNHLYGNLLAAPGNTKGIYSDGGASTLANGTNITVDNVVFIRDVRPELDPSQVHTVEGTPTSGADSHEVIVGTDFDDYIHARGGDDTVYGEGGNDKIFGDGGVDRLYGNDGDDIIDTGEGPDLADGGAGKDTIYGRGSGSEVGGFDQLVGGSGNDLIVGGEGIDKLSGGSGDDIIYGDGLANAEMGNTDPFTHGGDGNDYIDGGASGDLLYGEEGDDVIVGGNDQDLMLGGVGDDILRPGNPSQAINGGPDEVVGDDGYINSGFDIIDFSDLASGAPGVTLSLLNQANPLVAIDGTTPVPAMAQLEGIIGSRGNDDLNGDIVANAATAIVEENNWLIGGSGNDILRGAAGNDLLVGGSIRLDALIGTFTDGNATLNAPVGSAEWLATVMATGGAGTGYDNNTEDAYSGASNRAVGDIGGGLLAGAGFDAHFVDMLRSKMFKDTVLGDDGVDGTADLAVFRGNRADYSIEALDAAGAPTTSAAFAYKITDLRAADVVDVDGNPIHDGTDILVGVDSMQFADITLALSDFGNTAATGAAIISGFATANTQLVAVPVFPFGPLTVDSSSIGDADGLGTFSYQWEFSTDAGVTWIAMAGATAAAYQAQPANLGAQLRAVVTYTDGAGVAERIISAATDITGEYLQDTPGNAVGELQGGAGQDILVGLGGNDQLQGNGGNDWLDGGAGSDQMQGGAGNDTYVVNAAGDTINEGVNGGIDTVRSSVSQTLAANIENLILTGTGNGTGNALDNLISGSATNNVLSGGGGNDTLDGGAGNDTAVFSGAVTNFAVSDGAGDTIIVTDSDDLSPDEGTDTLTSMETLRFNNVNYAVVSGDASDNNNLNGANGAGGAQAVFGRDGDDLLNGGAGNDLLNGGAGDDTITQASNQGVDIINGGDNTAAGDRFVLNGTTATETFDIYTRMAYLAVNPAAVLQADTEIIVTRGGAIISQLDNIEEITINGTPQTNGAPGNGNASGDTIVVHGDFAETSLNLNTIRIAGAGIIDISNLDSSHRVVIEAQAGLQLIGALRPQDVLVLPEGATITSTSTDAGLTTLTTSAGTITFQGSTEHILSAGSEIPADTQEDDSDINGDDITDGTDDVNDDIGGNPGDVVTDGPSGTATVLPFVVFAGTVGNDAGFGGAGDDNLFGQAGDDSLFGKDGDDNIVGDDGNDDVFAGDGDDIVSGGTGNDRLFGDAGDDVMLGGAGNDRLMAGDGNDWIWGDADRDIVNGGLGNDVIFAVGGDGDDIYHGDAGIDTVNYEVVTGALLIDLDAGIARSIETGEDALSDIENAIGGRGNNTFYGNELANVLTGSTHSIGYTDTFVFRTAADANGDRIEGFQTGDKISLSSIFGSAATTVHTGDFNAAGQIRLISDVDGNTRIEGNTDGQDDTDFSILVMNHVLKQDDFTS